MYLGVELFALVAPAGVGGFEGKRPANFGGGLGAGRGVREKAARSRRSPNEERTTNRDEGRTMEFVGEY